MSDAAARLAALVRPVRDFPQPGVLFKDITPLLADAAAFAAAVDAMVAPWRADPPDLVVGMESRGFILGAAAALRLGCGFVPIRKPGRLPAETLVEDYVLEYASGRLEIHADAVAAGQRVLLMDDVLATGGTLMASRRLVERLGGAVVGAAVLVEIATLGGRAHWAGPSPLHAVLRD
ncbi:adenine phosphoribosyltransferase [Coralloluteibacterium stylophorae]|uniref:Adenine phosphoribosyltransferase n=1 Tax=Coralloluteibacterium stylophorae TaxID=1776034 RepID=A0A8J8AWT0_9GAMM|nr:adenine phosphoribosyltransferase [Coralloluteibacterium stylophorae]